MISIQELNKTYTFHDSQVDSITYDATTKTLTLVLDFCFWAQIGYDPKTPKTGLLKVVFEGVEEYDGIQGSEKSNVWAVQDGDIKEDKYHFCIEDISEDVSNPSYHDIYISANGVEVEDLRDK